MQDPSDPISEAASGSESINMLKQEIEEIENALAEKKTEVDKLNQALLDHKEELQELQLSMDIERARALAPDLFDPISPEASPRSTFDITLQVTIQVGGNVPKSTHSFEMPAVNSTTLNELRANIVSVGSENRALQRMTLWEDASLERLIKDLNRVTFKLEEDGHAASMNITPTRVDRRCAFPETEYGAWYYRNVRRGKKTMYEVNVYITV
ncbi:hypothetical protein A1O3_00305 [Capronia epimyces CBS 606.96]|uniref:Uncharacterized protein n=1 Tax=Capronia epimyces CBS 606.96 TaxID=1182542 RepID=W9YQ08_9EURO|nr:uncharacterized protein A1O3_00305 [Capronia epimyces CBS 606.96]EXJ91755.1 hypothetical protein A1O3_00305 [Capronia epimyces CBS 606.96]